MINVAICVCTRNRPKMLKECLDSLSIQLIDENKYNVAIVVVENSLVEECRDIVRSAAKISQFPVVYAHEPMVGIASARNRSIDVAKGLFTGKSNITAINGHDMVRDIPHFVAMIDDDETAECDWLAQLLLAQQDYNADVVYGDVLELFEVEPKWIVPRRAGRPVKIGCKAAPTNCTLFRWGTTFGKGYRFNEAYNLSGGSDTELTMRLVRDGALIVRTPTPQVFEEVPEERCSLRWYMRHAYRVEAVNTRIAMELDGPLKTTPVRLLKAATQTGKAVFKGLLAALTFSRIRWLKAVRNGAHAAGIVSALIGYLPEPYRKTTGY